MPQIKFPIGFARHTQMGQAIASDIKSEYSLSDIETALSAKGISADLHRLAFNVVANTSSYQLPLTSSGKIAHFQANGAKDATTSNPHDRGKIWADILAVLATTADGILQVNATCFPNWFQTEGWTLVGNFDNKRNEEHSIVCEDNQISISHMCHYTNIFSPENKQVECSITRSDKYCIRLEAGVFKLSYEPKDFTITFDDETYNRFKKLADEKVNKPFLSSEDILFITPFLTAKQLSGLCFKLFSSSMENQRDALAIINDYNPRLGAKCSEILVFHHNRYSLINAMLEDQYEKYKNEYMATQGKFFSVNLTEGMARIANYRNLMQEISYDTPLSLLQKATILYALFKGGGVNLKTTIAKTLGFHSAHEAAETYKKEIKILLNHDENSYQKIKSISKKINTRTDSRTILSNEISKKLLDAISNAFPKPFQQGRPGALESK
jgi:hypothetical protein